MELGNGITITGGTPDQEVLTAEALDFVARLHRQFNPRRRELLAARIERQARLDAGERPDFCAGTRSVRRSSWTVAPVPKDLLDRRVEITGPTDRKMMINALNSGARVFMADFEDSMSPTWANVVAGQRNLHDAVRRTISLDTPDGRHYQLADETATLMVRPRGWHLVEQHMGVDGEPVSASLFDFGMAFFHNARELLDQGSGPYFYLPKLENHLEALLWNDVFLAAQRALGLASGTIKATVLVETVLAAFEMDEILYELREHSAGLNAGRWDYIFSAIKKFRLDPAFVLPDRAQVSMAVPFMRAYTELLVATCHRRGAHAIGGMAAFIPNRRDPEVTSVALAKVREDKLREAAAGFDGTWVAHPDLVPVAMDVFDDALGDRPNQLECLRDDVAVTAADLLAVGRTEGRVTEQGVRTNVSVGVRYLESWLRGVGAAAIFNLMEDAATAEISRAQLWQWRRHRVALVEGPIVTAEYLRRAVADEVIRLRAAPGVEPADRARLGDAGRLFERVIVDDDFAEFLTIPAYGQLLLEEDTPMEISR
ncbi:MAG: malate synthase [Actinomycetota bacterium]|nr:malate synthase [Actinomycetota bacterium]